MSAKLRKGSEAVSKQNIISDYKKLVESKWDEGIFDHFRVLEQHRIRLMAVGDGTRCEMFFYCRPDVALKKLVELLKGSGLDSILQTHVNQTMKTKAISLQFDCNAEDYERCKEFYDSIRPVGKYIFNLRCAKKCTYQHHGYFFSLNST